MAKTSASIKLAKIEARTKRVELQLRVGVEERAMVLQAQQEMRDRELASKERMLQMQCDLEMARLKAGQPSGAAPVHPVGFEEGHLVGDYPPNFSQQDLFAFGANALARISCWGFYV
jgi:hypothetical protein